MSIIFLISYNNMDYKKGILYNTQLPNCSIKKTTDIDDESLGLKEPVFTNIMYDNTNYANTESMKPGVYKLTERNNTDNCYQEFPGFNSKTYGALSSQIDIENELKGLNYPLSKDNIIYNKVINCDKCDKCNSGISCDCSHCVQKLHYIKKYCTNQLIPQTTRNLKSCNDLSAIDYNRFDYIDSKKINHIQLNNYIGDNTRIEMKELTKKIKSNSNFSNYKFKKACYCGKMFGIHTTLDCMYEKDIK